MSFHIRQMGGDPTDAYSCDYAGLGSSVIASPGATDIPDGGVHIFYYWDLSFADVAPVMRIWPELIDLMIP